MPATLLSGGVCEEWGRFGFWWTLAVVDCGVLEIRVGLVGNSDDCGGKSVLVFVAFVRSEGWRGYGALGRWERF